MRGKESRIEPLTSILNKLPQMKDEEEAMSYLQSVLESIDDCHTLKDVNDNTLAHTFTMNLDLINLSRTVKAYQELLIKKRSKAELFYKWITMENDNQYTVYEIISENPNKEILKFLFDIIKDRQDICYCLLMKRMNVFHYAVLSSNVYSLIFFYEKLKALNRSNNILNYSTQDGFTPLHKACLRINRRMVDLLIKLGCNINAVDKEGNTPIICAVKLNSYDIVKKLLLNGANTEIKGKEKKTALELAILYDYGSLIRLMKPKSWFDRIIKCQATYSPLKTKSKLICVYAMFFILFAFKAITLLLFSSLHESYDIKEFIKCPFDEEHCLADRLVYLLGLIIDCISFFLIVSFNLFADKYYIKNFKKEKNKSLTVYSPIYSIRIF